VGVREFLVHIRQTVIKTRLVLLDFDAQQARDEFLPRMWTRTAVGPQLAEEPCLAQAERLGVFVGFEPLDDAYTPVFGARWDAMSGKIDL
jgi:hypothetical protein